MAALNDAPRPAFAPGFAPAQARPWWRRWIGAVPAALFAGFVAAGCSNSPGYGGYGGSGSLYAVRNHGSYHSAGTTASSPEATPNAEFAPIHAPGVFHDASLVRVHVLNGREAFDLSIDGAVEVFDNNLQSVEVLDCVRPQPVTLTGASLAIGNHIYYGVDRLELRLKAPSRCQIDDEDMGSAVKVLTIFRNPGERKLHCVVSWPVEDYLYGVLAGEVPVEWPAEALKAQAVASRTYVLYQMHDRRYEEFDVERTVSSQVFKTGDAKKIDARFTSAVDATQGEYMISGGTVFPAYFHSTCGGETASSVDVFGGDPITALAGHEHETACSASNVYRWTRKFPLSEFEARLAKKKLWDSAGGNTVINILPVGPVEATSMQRATMFVVIGEHSRKYIPANDFRLAFGGGRNDLPSTLFTRWRVEKGQVLIDGQGWGHGVGMCQFGAMGRAKAGETYKQILGFYYAGAALKTGGAASAMATAPVAPPAAVTAENPVVTAITR